MWIATSVFIQLIRSNMCRFARTRLGDVSYCAVICSRDKYFWCIFKLRAPPLSSPPSLFSLHPSPPPPHSYFYSFRLGRASSFARPWPAFFVLASEIFQSQVEIVIFGVNPEITNKTTDYSCLFLFHPCLFSSCRLYLVYFQQLLFLFQSSLRFFSPVSGLLNLHCHPFPIIPLVVVWLLPCFGSETAVAKLAHHLWPTFVRLILLLTQTGWFFVQSKAVKGGKKTGN